MVTVVDVFLVLILLYALYYLKSPGKKYNLPPGPFNIPFISGLSAIKGQPSVAFQLWATRYGPLIRTKLGFQDALIIDDPQLMREAFNNPAFSGRMDHKAFTIFSGGKRGIVSGEGDEWNEQRRFAIRTLRDFGFGKGSMEMFIMEEITEFLTWMKTREGQGTEMKTRLVVATVNTLWKMIAGVRQDHNDDELRDKVDKANKHFNEAANPNSIWIMFPILIKILPKFLPKEWHNVAESVIPFQQIFKDAIDHHIANPVDEPRDLIDVYIKEVKKTTNPNSSFYGPYGTENIRTIVSDLYGAGQATTSNLLAWTIIYLVRFPEVQTRFQAELDTVIGPNRHPSLADRPNLPYTEALTMEVHRYASHIQLGIFHQTTEDTRLGGYDIRKNTVVIPNIYSMNFSQKRYGDPENFRPARFLSPDGLKVLKCEDLMPFSTGKRQCLGETLGRDNYFLFITSLFHRFEIGPDPTEELPSLEPAPGFFREPERFSVVFKDRL